MTQERVASKIIIRERAPAVRQLVAAPVSQGAFLGIAERGPVGTPTLLTSWADYQKIFGGYTASGDLAQAVAGFFENGGRQCYVVRTMHYNDLTDPDTYTGVAATNYLVTPGAATPATLTGTNAGPFVLNDGETLVVDVDGGGDVTSTFNAAPATLTSGNTDTYDLDDGMTLTVKIDNGLTQTITFNTADFSNIDLATAEEVAAVINQDLIGGKAYVSGGTNVVIESDKSGTGSAVQVTGGTANTPLGFSTTATAGTGDFADISAATVAELKTVIEADIAGLTVQAGAGGVIELVSNTTGLSSSLEVDGTSTAAATLGLTVDSITNGSDSGSVNSIKVDGKYPGTYGDRVDVEVRDAASGETDEFGLVVYLDDKVAETFSNLSMDTASARYVETIVNDSRDGSFLVALTDQLVGGAPRPANQTIALSGGDDGLTSLADTDFLGNATGLTGLRAFNTVQGAPIFAVPGRATVAVHTGLIDYIEQDRSTRGFPVLASDEGMTAVEVADYANTTAGLTGLSEFGAFYWPRVKVLNPDSTVFGNDAEIIVSPEGHIAGVYARTDAASPGGVYESPAGTDVGRLYGVTGLDSDEPLEETKMDLVASKLVNPITLDTGSLYYINGVDVLKVDENFPTVPERRGVIFIEETIRTGLEVYRFRRNDARLRNEVKGTIDAFLTLQTSLGAFRYDDPAEAFYTEVDDDPDLVFQNRLVVRVQLATAKPAKYIEVEFSQSLGA